MARKYHTLISKGNEAHHNGEWVIEFGDYDKECIKDEMSEMKERAAIDQESISFKIITTGANQADINAAVAKLNK